ncbi:hypothetical protein [Micromonospora sp. NPDC005324]|uniref:hypothetical protein n=1 Tax=Micromonospora sp. NPDC005324 TaxID=3157033 RepID=UPI0033BF9A07
MAGGASRRRRHRCGLVTSALVVQETAIAGSGLTLCGDRGEAGLVGGVVSVDGNEAGFGE